MIHGSKGSVTMLARSSKSATEDPLVLQAADACLRLCDKVVLVGKHNPSNVPLVQNLSLTIAAVERQLNNYINEVLDQVSPDGSIKPKNGYNGSSSSNDVDGGTLTATAARLHAMMPKLEADRYSPLPTGGLESMLSYFATTFTDINSCLEQTFLEKPELSIRLWDSGKYLLFMTSFIYVVIQKILPRRVRRLLLGKYRQQLQFAYLAIASRGVYMNMSTSYIRQQNLKKLEKYERQLSILSRLWVIVMSTVKRTKMTKNVSYQILVPEYHVSDDVDHLKPHAQRVLQSVPLPSAAAFWYDKDNRLAIVKRLMDTFYAASSYPHKIFRKDWQWNLFGKAAMVISLPFYLLMPTKTSEIAHREIANGDCVHIHRCWNMMNAGFIRYPLQLLAKYKGLVVQKSMTIAGVPCQVLSSNSADLEFLNNPNAGGPLPEKNVIFFCHGGGFLSCMLSSDLDIITEWAVRTDAIIVYPEYSLAPEHVFPTQLNEIHRVYKSVIRGDVGFVPKKIIVTGDSAGGNLTAALQLKLTMIGGRRPDGLVLIYPALQIGLSPSPSRTAHIQDPILPHGLLLAVSKNYRSMVPSEVPDPLISPAVATDQMLEQFPPTYIMVGGLDPLLDESIDYDIRLRRLNVPGGIQVVNNLPHGFIMLGGLLPQAREAIRTTGDWMVQMLNGDAKAEKIAKLLN